MSDTVRKKAVVKLLLLACVVGVMAAFPGSRARADLQINQGPPPGFEQLETPRLTAVTLYYGGELLGVFPAHFTPNTLQFDKPMDIIAAVPAISDTVKVTAALGVPLPAHAERLCAKGSTEGCDTLEPEVAGVIFNESHLSAELFINKNYLAVVDQDATRYLPLPERNLSSVYTFSGAVSGTDTSAPNFTLTDNSNFGYGEGKFTSQSTLSNAGLRFDTATASIEREGEGAAMGLFRSRAMQLLADRDIAGVAVFSSMQTVLDDHKKEGNEVILYLPRRAFVSIYREGHLYSSRPYEAGNQRIDTSELPDGAYEITLKIQEADGTTREEHRFYAKTENIPPPGAPVYYLQAGVIRNPADTDATVPQLTGDPILRVGTSRRIDDNVGLTVNGLGVKDRGFLETGLFWLNGEGQVMGTFLTSTRGDIGWQAGYIRTEEKLSMSFDLRELWTSHQPIPGYEDVAQDVAQASATLRYAITPDFSVGARGSYARESDSPQTITYGPYAEWNIWQEGDAALGVTADMARTNGQNQGSLIMHFTHRFGEYGVTSTGGYGYGPGANSPLGSARVWHDDPTPGNALLVGAGISGDRNQQVASADANWRNHVGQVEGGIQEILGQTGPAFNYGGSFAFDAATLSDEVYVGGDHIDRSAVIVETQGDGIGTMRIYVNGAEQSRVDVGSRRVVYLSPFHVYNIRLVPEKDTMLDYDGNERKVTLYPGNVVKLTWKINSLYVIAGRVAEPDGKPLVEAVLQESREPITTDQDGHLQAEVSKSGDLTFMKMDKSLCRVHLPDDVTPTRGILLYRQPLVCQAVSRISTP